MPSISSSLFGPLNVGYCNYFYYLSVIALIMLILTILSLLYSLLILKVRSQFMVMNSITIMISLFLGYFSNRLLYTMCQASVK